MEQELYNTTTAITELAKKIILNPVAYIAYDKDLYEAQSILTTAWCSMRAAKRVSDLNKVDDAAMEAKLQIVG